jgi:hypothetical protein
VVTVTQLPGDWWERFPKLKRLVRLDHLSQPPELRKNGPQAVVDHMTRCHPVGAAIVFDGNADDTVAKLLAAGWTWTEGTTTEYVAGKRLRYLTPPASLRDEQIFRALRGDDRL